MCIWRKDRIVNKKGTRSKVLDGGGNLKIIAYEDRYRDDLIFMILEAKSALGRVPVGTPREQWFEFYAFYLKYTY